MGSINSVTSAMTQPIEDQSACMPESSTGIEIPSSLLKIVAHSGVAEVSGLVGKYRELRHLIRPRHSAQLTLCSPDRTPFPPRIGATPVAIPPAALALRADPKTAQRKRTSPQRPTPTDYYCGPAPPTQGNGEQLRRWLQPFARRRPLPRSRLHALVAQAPLRLHVAAHRL